MLAVMIMYKPLADSTLMSMTKKEIIEQLRIAEHNFKAMEETVNQQAENFIKLLAEERKHGHWIKLLDPNYGIIGIECSACKCAVRIDTEYCPYCGAVMDEEAQK